MEDIGERPGLLQRTKEFFFPPSVETREQLLAFLNGEASYLAQKTVMGYCRVKTLLAYEKLLTEAAFRDGLEHCRWETFSLTLGDAIVLAENTLRNEAGSRRPEVIEGLARLYPEIIAQHHAPHRPEGWADRCDEFARRFALSSMSVARPPADICKETAKVVLDLVPLHIDLKKRDLEIIAGDLGLHMLALSDSMGRRFRQAALIAALTA